MSSLSPAASYADVTETVGTNVTREAIDMLRTRYEYAASFCLGRDVLEVACGAAPGLGLLLKTARRVIGGDYTDALLRLGRGHYRDRVPLVRLDAHALPFSDRSFDVVLLYEALYYLAEPQRFVREARRLLRPGGVLVICSANPDRLDFTPSPQNTRYLRAQDLLDMMGSNGFAAEVSGAFPVQQGSRSALLAAIKRVATALHLIPRSIKGRQWLKRIFLGPLIPFPAELRDDMGTFHPPVPLEPTQPTSGFKVLYAVGRVNRQEQRNWATSSPS